MELQFGERFGGRRPTWGYAASPVIFQDKLLIVTGAEDASLISLDTETGEVFWKSGNYEAVQRLLFMKTKVKFWFFTNLV